jgi:hypothetical protein
MVGLFLCPFRICNLEMSEGDFTLQVQLIFLCSVSWNIYLDIELIEIVGAYK